MNKKRSMKFVEVEDISTGRLTSVLLSRIEMFYPIVEFKKGVSSSLLKEVIVGTSILLESGNILETSVLYSEFKERVFID